MKIKLFSLGFVCLALLPQIAHAADSLQEGAPTSLDPGAESAKIIGAATVPPWESQKDVLLGNDKVARVPLKDFMPFFPGFEAKEDSWVTCMPEHEACANEIQSTTDPGKSLTLYIEFSEDPKDLQNRVTSLQLQQSLTLKEVQKIWFTGVWDNSIAFISVTEGSPVTGKEEPQTAGEKESAQKVFRTLDFILKGLGRMHERGVVGVSWEVLGQEDPGKIDFSLLASMRCAQQAGEALRKCLFRPQVIHPAAVQANSDLKVGPWLDYHVFGYYVFLLVDGGFNASQNQETAEDSYADISKGALAFRPGTNLPMVFLLSLLWQDNHQTLPHATTIREILRLSLKSHPLTLAAPFTVHSGMDPFAISEFQPVIEALQLTKESAVSAVPAPKKIWGIGQTSFFVIFSVFVVFFLCFFCWVLWSLCRKERHQDQDTALVPDSNPSVQVPQNNVISV